MMSVWQGVVLAFVCMNAGLIMEMYCAYGDSKKDRLCRENGQTLKMLGGAALCVLAVYISYRYAKAAANGK